MLPGGDVTLHPSGAPGFKLDRVGIYRKGDPPVKDDLGLAAICARIAGDLIFPKTSPRQIQGAHVQ